MEKCSTTRHPRSGPDSSPLERGTVYAKDSRSRVDECSPPESSRTASPLRTGLRWIPLGSMIGRLASLPRLSVATEGFPPSVAIAAPRLRSTGVHLVVTSETRQALPFAAGTFELVISRHPIEVWWREIARVLRPGGTYFAQHVGPHSLCSLSEFFMGRLPDASNRDTEVERRAAEAAGLVVQSMRLEHPRTAFFDIGAVVYFLRVVPWIAPGFTVPKYRDALRELHETIERHGAFETSASRTLIEATKPS
jgi:SAM-dependent methyltransferase